MPLESTMICLDNSDWMRNGDYIPTRLDAQQEAASLICTQRTDSHPESTVGLMTMAGEGVEVLASPTENIGKVLATFAGIKSSGKTEFVTAVSIAQLALRHRKNKNGGQRIIVFIGSPVYAEEKELKKIGSSLKKNKIAIDVVVMGEHEDIQAKMSGLVDAANTNDNSHLILVPPGVQPSDALVTSPIFQGEGVAMGGTGGGDIGGGGGGDLFAEYGGIDPSLDPELAMVMRVSAEEARQQEEARLLAASKQSVEETEGGSNESKDNGEESKQESKGDLTSTTSSQLPQSLLSNENSGDDDEDDDDDDEALLQAALAISLQESKSEEVNVKSLDITVEEDQEDDMDEEMRLALAMSIEKETNETTSTTAATSQSSLNDAPAVLLDADFVNQLLGSVEVDKDDPLIQAALKQLNAGLGDLEAKDKKNNEEEKKDDSSAGGNKKRKDADR